MHQPLITPSIVNREAHDVVDIPICNRHPERSTQPMTSEDRGFCTSLSARESPGGCLRRSFALLVTRTLNRSTDMQSRGAVGGWGSAIRPRKAEKSDPLDELQGWSERGWVNI